MNPDEIDLLRARLLGETARADWDELHTFFARGKLIRVHAELDLIEVAVQIATDQSSDIEILMQSGRLGPLDDATAVDWQQRHPPLWAVVLAPWVLVQERAH